MNDEIRDYLSLRAKNERIAPYELYFDPEEGDETFLITILYEGAIYEEFYLGETLYEVNIADWLAEREMDIKNFEQHDFSWEVHVSAYNFGVGEDLYRITSEDV